MAYNELLSVVAEVFPANAEALSQELRANARRFSRIYTLKNMDRLKSFLSELYNIRINQRKLVNMYYIRNKAREFGTRVGLVDELIRIISKYSDINFFEYTDDDLAYFESKYGVKFTEKEKQIIKEAANQSVLVAALIYIKRKASGNKITQRTLVRDFNISEVSLRKKVKSLKL